MIHHLKAHTNLSIGNMAALPGPAGAAEDVVIGENISLWSEWVLVPPIDIEVAGER